MSLCYVADQFSFQTSFDRKTCFLKIHAPTDVINRGGENLGIQKPTKDYILTYYASGLMDMVRNELKMLRRFLAILIIASNAYFATFSDCLISLQLARL